MLTTNLLGSQVWEWLIELPLIAALCWQSYKVGKSTRHLDGTHAEAMELWLAARNGDPDILAMIDTIRDAHREPWGIVAAHVQLQTGLPVSVAVECADVRALNPRWIAGFLAVWLVESGTLPAEYLAGRPTAICVELSDSDSRVTDRGHVSAWDSHPDPSYLTQPETPLLTKLLTDITSELKATLP